MTSTTRERIRIGEPGDLLDTIPYLLGFHPRQSVVIVGLADSCPGPKTSRSTPTSVGSTSRSTSTSVGSSSLFQGPTPEVQLVIRADLADVGEGGGVASLVPPLIRAGCSAAVVVAFVDAAQPGAGLAVVAAVVADIGTALRASDVRILDLLVATPERWWSMSCNDAACCPAEGRARGKGVTVPAAQATYAGLVALGSRQEVADQFTGRDASARRRLDSRLERAENRVHRARLAHRLDHLRAADHSALLAAAARRRADSATAPLSPAEIARFGVALTDVQARDLLWTALDDGSVDATRLLLELLRELPAPYDAAPLFLFGWSKWRLGNGTIASIAAERALESDPGYSAAALLLTAVQSGLDPRTTPTLRNPNPRADDFGGHGGLR
jgi:hypothetical protein